MNDKYYKILEINNVHNKCCWTIYIIFLHEMDTQELKGKNIMWQKTPDSKYHNLRELFLAVLHSITHLSVLHRHILSLGLYHWNHREMEERTKQRMQSKWFNQYAMLRKMYKNAGTYKTRQF